jgi:hypothetical protein
MPAIDVVSSRDDGTSLLFEVTVEEEGSATTHDVAVSRSDLDRLSRQSESPEQFVKRVFAFLLEREPKESILSSFDISVISRYFPEFEDEIRR